jgi:hypothetical protein
LNSDHAFWNNANLLMYLEGFLKSPSTVRVLAPDVWKVATGLPPVLGQKNIFRAENFDILYDSPFEASNFKTLVFNVKGVPHRIVIDGTGNYDPERMRRDVQKIVETQVELMGGEIPYRDYTFILHLRNDAGGGLEHANSTALGYPRFGFRINRGDRATSAAPSAWPSSTGPSPANATGDSSAASASRRRRSRGCSNMAAGKSPRCGRPCRFSKTRRWRAGWSACRTGSRTSRSS